MLSVPGFDTDPIAGDRFWNKRRNLSGEEFRGAHLRLHPITLIVVGQTAVDPNGAFFFIGHAASEYIADGCNGPAVFRHRGNAHPARSLRGKKLKPIFQLIVRSIHVQEIFRASADAG